MADYYASLSRALKSGDSANAQWRRDVYDQARTLLQRQLSTARPPLSKAEIKLHADALEAAIKSIENEFPRRDAGGAAHPARPDSRPPAEHPRQAARVADEGPIAKPVRFSPVLLVGFAVVVAALCAAAYAFWSKPRESAPPQVKSETPPRPPSPAPLADGDLAPGVDGGSSDADVPYVFRRQPVFYRTTHPAGTIIIDKQQHFLYLVAPNLVALRYGIGLGGQCEDVAGLRHISGKREWPSWQPPPEMIERKLAAPGVMPGGPGNPLGARVLDLDDGSSRIHGTNAPRTIGTTVEFGCFRLINDEIGDLYNRVAIGARVIVGD